MSNALLSNIIFTKSIGRRDDNKDASFNDAIEFLSSDGEFPANFKIKGIKQVDVFSNEEEDDDDAVITGLTIQYDGVDEPISHGRVVNVTNVGTLKIDPGKTFLLGVFGRLKNQDGDNYKRIASIGFVVFDGSTGKVKAEGPWQGSTEYLAYPWATLGPVIAFQGTTKDGIGLTTLGFVKTVDGVPGDVKVLESKNSNKSLEQEVHIF